MKVIKVLILVLTFFTLLLGIPETGTAFVDPNYKLVEWKGWGTSLSWFADALGSFSEPVQNRIYTAIFSPDSLNLNILRYTIGGTTLKNNSCGSFNLGNARESFRDGPDRLYDWSRDSLARNVVLAAKAFGVDTFEAISRSPPDWLTRSGCSQGNPNGAPLHDNLDPANAYAFADYLTEVVKHYHDVHNISFSYLSPFWEPSSGYFFGNGMEGCNMIRSTIVEVIRGVHASLQLKNLTFCQISASEERSTVDEMDTQKALSDAGVTQLYSKINAKRNLTAEHKSTMEINSVADKMQKELWMSKVWWHASYLPNMSQALQVAEGIIYDLRNMLPSAWVYWQVVESTGSGSLIHAPYSSDATEEEIRLTSGYYAMMQFSKYIRKGYSLIHVSDWNSVAAYDERSRNLIIVTVNAGPANVEKTYDLGTFSELGQIHVIRTSKFEPHVAIPPPVPSNNQLTFGFPPDSVTTFQIRNAIPILADNLLRNGDFESSSSSPWVLLFGARDDNGVNGNYTRRGNKSGFLDFNQSKLTLAQNITVPQSKTYYLTAWSATTGNNTLLGILVNGMQGPEVNIVPFRGYQIYGLAVDAQPNDVLTVFLHSEQGNHTAQIDDIMLH